LQRTYRQRADPDSLGFEHHDGVAFDTWRYLATGSDQQLDLADRETLEEWLRAGGDILTMRGPAPEYVESLAVKDGTILFAGAHVPPSGPAVHLLARLPPGCSAASVIAAAAPCW